MVVRRKGRGECPAGTKEYYLINRSQMTGRRIESVVICAKNDIEAIKEFKESSYPHSLWKRIS